MSALGAGWPLSCGSTFERYHFHAAVLELNGCFAWRLPSRSYQRSRCLPLSTAGWSTWPRCMAGIRVLLTSGLLDAG